MTHAHAGGGNKGRGPRSPAGLERTSEGTSEGTSETTSPLPYMCQGRAGAAHTNPIFPVPRQGEVVQRQSLCFASLVFGIVLEKGHFGCFTLNEKQSAPWGLQHPEEMLAPGHATQGYWLQNPQARRWTSITTPQQEDCAPRPPLADSIGSEERAEKHSSQQQEWDANSSSPIPLLPSAPARLCACACSPKGKREQAEAVCHPR